MPYPITAIQEILDRGVAYVQECRVIVLAIEALCIDPDDLQLDHPLVSLIQALLLSTHTNDVVHLSRLHRELLAEAIERLQRNAFDRLRREATADRLRLMARRAAAYADEFEDVELALATIGIDLSEDHADDVLVNLYHDLSAEDAPRGPRSLSEGERQALMRAAEMMAKGED
jgi:hypothetical protein